MMRFLISDLLWLDFFGGALIAIGGCIMVAWLHRGYPYLPQKERDKE